MSQVGELVDDLRLGLPPQVIVAVESVKPISELERVESPKFVEVGEHELPSGDRERRSVTLGGWSRSSPSDSVVIG